MMRNILLDYGATNDLTPYEYMKSYIEKCPENTVDSKLSWIAETFLAIQKHGLFLREIASHLSGELTDEEQDYFMIVLVAVTFQITPKNMHFLYKSLFNLSKNLLNTFTKFLSNNEVLTFISQIAGPYYDKNYVTEKILGPLFTWQPYISEMAHSYAEHVKKIDSRKVKPPTIPIQPNVLNKKVKELPISPPPSVPLTPPNSVRNKGKRMLTKSTIDKKLKNIHETNRHKSTLLLQEVKNKEFHFAQSKSENYYKKIASIKDDMENEFTKPQMRPKLRPSQKMYSKNTLPPIKENAATIKRMNKRIQLTEQEELEWLQKLITTHRNEIKIEELLEYDRQENERSRLIDIEKNHLKGQISHEEALLAKHRLLEENRKKYEGFLKEKEAWNKVIEKWKENQMEKSRRSVEKLSLIELNIIEAKHAIATKKKETAEKLKKESDMLIAEAMKVQKEELERKIKMIKEIKILSMIARKANVPKIIDLTESSGLGLLCEMSIAELQERLSAMKMGLKEELERKKSLIREENAIAKQELEDAKNAIQYYVAERAALRKTNKKFNINSVSASSKEINELKKILEEKQRLRIKLLKS